MTDAEHLILDNQLVIMAALTTLLNADNAQNVEDMQQLLGDTFTRTEAVLELDDAIYEGIAQ
jgi:uncharacterized protein YfbU (UPF0304 family)